jgi:hypothetical protein
MAGGLVVEIWKEWGIQILVVASFLLQLVLLVFAGIRRRSSSTVLMTLLWLAYLMADNVAVYALGQSLDSRLHEDGLIAFWAPFFLLHLGGQDNITAYSLEDNQLWKRHLLTLLIQASGAGYTIYRYILPGIRSLLSATILMFIVGFLKYGERVLALKRANGKIISPFPFDHQYKSEQVDVEEQLLLDSHNMLKFGQSAFLNVEWHLRLHNFCDGIEYIFQSRLYNRDVYMYDLVEVQLSLMYDLLYTKVTVIHTWYGWCIRVISMHATVAAFLLFHLAGKGAYSRVDVAITYLLLVGAIILEIASVFRLIGSIWTCVYLDYREYYQTNVVLMRLRQLVNAGRKRRWLNSIGQHNVLDYSSRDQTKLRGRITKAIGLIHWWQKVHFSSNVPITTKFKELVVQQIVKTMHDSEKWSIRDARGRAVLTDCRMLADVGWSVENIDFGNCILIWHVATDMYICHYDDYQRVKTEEEQHLVKAIKVLSNYMGFLLLVRPNFLPEGLQYFLLEKSYQFLEHDVASNNYFRLEDKLFADSQEEEHRKYPKFSTSKKLAMHLVQMYDKEDVGAVLRTDCYGGAQLACKLLYNEWELPNVLEVIFTVWVEFLCYAAHHSTGASHCRQLGRGGDFLTVIRLVVDHNELFQKAEVERLAREAKVLELSIATED